MQTKFWQLIKPPDYEQDEKRRVAVWLQIMLVFIAVSSLLLAATSIFLFPQSGSWPVSLIGCSVAVVAAYFNRRGNLTIATLLPLIWLLSDATRGLYIGNGIHDTAILYFAAIVTLGGLLLRRRAYLVLFALIIAAITFVVYSEMHGWTVSPLSSKTDYSDVIMISVFLGGQALVLTLVMDGYFKSLQAERHNAQTLRALLNAFTDPMFLIDTSGNFLYLNEAQAEQAGNNARNLLGTRSYDQLPPDLAREHETMVAEVVANGWPKRVEHQRAERWFEHNFYPIHDEQGQVYRVAVYIRDVTFYKQATEEIRTLNTELEQRVHERTMELETANRELEAFSYTVSHDLRSPLRAINGFAKILEDDFSRDLHPMALGFLRKIRAAGDKMTQLIDDLLDFSRIGRKALEKQAVNLNKIVQQVVDSLAHETANRQVEWKLAELPSAHADPILLQQVYMNLLDNAVKYTGKREQAWIEVGSFKHNDEIVYFVRDNGAGFDMQFAERLFGVFQRLHRDDEFDGTGIGLATVQRIIHRHGGRIWAEAELDKGAAFYFTLG